MTTTATSLADWVTAAFPDLPWQRSESRFGAFHNVIISEAGIVARITHGRHHQARARRESATLITVRNARLGLSVPQVLTPPVTRGAWTGYVITRVPGSHESATAWTDLRAAYDQTLTALAEAPTDIDLPPPRTWCEGTAFRAVVADQLGPLLGDHAQTAIRLIEDLLALPPPTKQVLAHGDFGHHNILWQGVTAQSLIDFDHACIDDQAIDVSPLIGSYGAQRVRDIVTHETLSRAMVHRATLSLQVAAAAHLAGSNQLRDHALGNFARRHQDGTLHDPSGLSP